MNRQRCVLAIPGVAIPGLAMIALSGLSAPAWGQASDLPIPAAVAADHFPAGITTRRVGDRMVYVDARGQTLYGMDPRALAGKTGTPFTYCKDACAEMWQPLLAPAGAKATPGIVVPGTERRTRPDPAGAGKAEEKAEAPAASAARKDSWNGDWAIVEGAQGLQWIYKKVHLVFTRRGEAPGTAAFDGAEDFAWNSLKYVPPAPKLSTPGAVTARFLGDGYVMADRKGRLLFTGDAPAQGGWSPFPAGFANGGSGDWSVGRTGEQAQWLYRGKPVFVADAPPVGGDSDAMSAIPTGGSVLRP
ncbi:hypothetical protein LWE61_06615 [Sphingobium sufflavum]|uniref:hypothetical protein n=1 Tax=Sphingobium sufflavum TaxID=1129547 RepID=UPI001F1FB4EA|nr:hypothetical protein [Sphingobium sufflavum]MCE7796232.1 hypothetical protein [Sphingobium sufflavum]